MTKEMYMTICVEWTNDNFGVGLMRIYLLFAKKCAYFRSQWVWSLTLWPQNYFYAFPLVKCIWRHMENRPKTILVLVWF